MYLCKAFLMPIVIDPKALELTTCVTQLSAFQQAIAEIQEINSDPGSESGKPLFEPGIEVLIKHWDLGAHPSSSSGKALPGYSFFSHSCQSAMN